MKNSIWYDCINYRVNIVSEKNRLYIRDVFKFREDYTEEFYDKPCHEWSITCDNMPVMDGFLWRRGNTDRAGVYFDGDVLVCEAVLSGENGAL